MCTLLPLLPLSVPNGLPCGISNVRAERKGNKALSQELLELRVGKGAFKWAKSYHLESLTYAFMSNSPSVGRTYVPELSIKPILGPATQ